jgi:tellurite resistance-related uncharacterized protein
MSHCGLAGTTVSIDASAIGHQPKGVWRIAAMDNDDEMTVQLFM